MPKLNKFRQIGSDELWNLRRKVWKMSEIKLNQLRSIDFYALGEGDGFSLRSSRAFVDPVFGFLQFLTVPSHQSRLGLL